MLSPEERAELEALKADPYVKLAQKMLRYPVDAEKKKLYQYRWLKKRGIAFAEEFEKADEE